MSSPAAKSVKLQILEKPSRIPIASYNLTARMLATVCSNVRVQERDYSNIKFGVVPKLSAGIILEQDFLNGHEKVALKLKRPKQELFVEANTYCSVYRQPYTFVYVITSLLVNGLAICFEMPFRFRISNGKIKLDPERFKPLLNILLPKS